MMMSLCLARAVLVDVQTVVQEIVMEVVQTIVTVCVVAIVGHTANQQRKDNLFITNGGVVYMYCPIICELYEKINYIHCYKGLPISV